ncbi:hypothetical protein M409DRAFT_20518 [Zasmidium cellare ATCC 36951]|uniref:SnoaL-like domain-containing protein n=1 Tax=Zasmidium cellare ATCC 36951 TaxID=1080233 RepID=A0A6A6CTY6_ZASCE|nr:uncharacterized protein M409DRAFT_20518 [Zasmidium cellare ATCC 36951]KAF2169292.1 hypothetical protein M409DRAFT_20518 [Zasmidium cellare ATCC 36951]
MSSTLLENIKKTTEAFFASYDTLNADEILEHWADNCVHKIRPDSLGRQKRNKEEYRAYVNSMAWAMKEFKYTPDRDTLTYDVENRRSAFYATGAGETPIGHFTNEYSFFLSFDESGKKLTRIDEFVDSGHTSKFFDEFRRVAAEGDKSEQVREFKKKYNITS